MHCLTRMAGLLPAFIFLILLILTGRVLRSFSRKYCKGWSWKGAAAARYSGLILLLWLCTGVSFSAAAWGFFAHRRINRLAVFCLPPEMLVLYKPALEYLTEHAVDPDKRRYLIAAEGPRHYIDMDLYGRPPYDSIPRGWQEALVRYTSDTLQQRGILPWHLEKMLAMLTRAFRERDRRRILQLSAELGHYVADAHVPLHACSNHNGQYTQQQGIHGLWESRIPELLADETFNYWAGGAVYITRLRPFIWQIVTGSALAADTVLRVEKALRVSTPASRLYAYESRNGRLVRNYANDYTKTYHALLGNMVERRMRGAIAAVAACWYTAWVNAGQPSLLPLAGATVDTVISAEYQQLQAKWLQGVILGREEAP